MCEEERYAPCHKPPHGTSQPLWRQMEEVNFLEGNLLEAGDVGGYCPLYTRTCRLNTRTSMHSTRGRESGGVRARHAGVVLRGGVWCVVCGVWYREVVPREVLSGREVVSRQILSGGVTRRELRLEETRRGRALRAS